MAKNKIQSQRSESLNDFRARYGLEKQCEDALFEWRWPAGFVCPECEHTGHFRLVNRAVFQCHRCHRQTSLTSGTLFAGSKLPLTVWFLALYLTTQAKNGILAMALSRQLGISYNSAWLLKHKLMQAMLEREQKQRLEGVVQMHDAYWGGRRRGYKRGRGTRGKTPFVAAVATDPVDGRPLRIRLDRVKGFRSREIERWSHKHLVPKTLVCSDKLACFRAVKKADCAHEPLAASGATLKAQRKAMVWVDTMLGNVKNALHGTYHALRPKHLPRYLAEFAYRFNRRYNLTTMPDRLGFAAANTPPLPYRFAIMAESHW